MSTVSFRILKHISNLLGSQLLLAFTWDQHHFVDCLIPQLRYVSNLLGSQLLSSFNQQYHFCIVSRFSGWSDAFSHSAASNSATHLRVSVSIIPFDFLHHIFANRSVSTAAKVSHTLAHIAARPCPLCRYGHNTRQQPSLKRRGATSQRVNNI